MSIQKTLEKYEIQQTIEVDGQMVTLVVQGQVNFAKNCQWQIIRRRTTKTFSHNPETNAAVLQRLGTMEAAMMEHLEGIRLEFGEPDEDDPYQIKLFPRDHENEFPDDGHEDEESDPGADPATGINFDTGNYTPPKAEKPKGRKAAATNLPDGFEGDGGSDDELNPGF
jgi:hypothetical protein